QTPDFSEGFVSADAARVRAKLQAYAAPGHFDGASQSAIIDHLAANGFDTADALQHLAPDQHATARGPRGPMARTADPGRRIEHEEKENIRWNQSAFGQRVATQADHPRNKVVSAAFRPRNQVS